MLLQLLPARLRCCAPALALMRQARSEEHTSELQSRPHLVCRLLIENATATSELYTLSLHDALPILLMNGSGKGGSILSTLKALWSGRISDTLHLPSKSAEPPDAPPTSSGSAPVLRPGACPHAAGKIGRAHV